MFGKKKEQKKKSILSKIVFSGGIISIAFFVAIVICILMIFNFFGANITVSTIENNYEYADMYEKSLNKYLRNGYVPLARMLYFYLEDDTLSFDDIYVMNINQELKELKSIEKVCTDERVKDMGACTTSNIKENKDFLEVTNQYFNFPLNTNYSITSFFKKQREVYGKYNVHGGWDFAVPSKTPVYSVCNGTITKVQFTQTSNIPYDQSGNSVGNNITIRCEDYGEYFYVTYRHLYPNSSKVKVGDRVKHWSEVAEVGTTGHSTGNHLHYEVSNSNNQLVDGMLLVDMSYSKPPNMSDF